ncbi:hypothetical protein Ais01nite_62590 [Asanoa ishikariensis]|uniref:Uncharacterized protein n=1 Tax=Asanoa ishikariensis TaxID=137265 RepID=A0A1H3NZZ1_9ACTN|nr:hypothetical protein [Asanoa ishikariensis]GIF68224.1 hypothetical protein Ais01nite_62590 [Asanoa ishikariensis]SDY94341.1 hypothetical protein SAMN05421684_2468 [Asanoa ishikariensis]
MADEFTRALLLMRRRDPQLAEDGFQRLRGLAAEHVDRLIDEFRREPAHDVRSRLLKLIAETGTPRALELMATQAHDDGKQPGI